MAVKVNETITDVNKNRTGNMKMLYSVKEISEVLGVSLHIAYDLIYKGYLPAMKLGGIKVRKAALEKFLEEYEGKDLTNLDNVIDFESSAKAL